MSRCDLQKSSRCRQNDIILLKTTSRQMSFFVVGGRREQVYIHRHKSVVLRPCGSCFFSLTSFQTPWRKLEKVEDGTPNVNLLIISRFKGFQSLCSSLESTKTFSLSSFFFVLQGPGRIASSNLVVESIFSSYYQVFLKFHARYDTLKISKYVYGSTHPSNYF